MIASIDFHTHVSAYLKKQATRPVFSVVTSRSQFLAAATMSAVVILSRAKNLRLFSGFVQSG
jgi:hypothetical protein